MKSKIKKNLKRKMKKKNLQKEPKKIPQVNIIGYVADLFGCYAYRLLYPSVVLNEYSGKDIRFNWFNLNRFIRDHLFYKSTTVVIFQRPSSKEHLKMMQALRNICIQEQCLLVYEVDDLLFRIPKYNYFANDYYEKNIKFCQENIRTAMYCTTTTSFLKKELQKFNKNVEIFPNYLPRFLWNDFNRPNIKNNKDKLKILWAGSSTHFSNKTDIQNDLDILCDVYFKTYNKYNWVFVGSVPDKIKNSGKPFILHKWKMNSEYPRFMKNLDVDISIGSLIDNDFNRAKSNIKRLEYTVCGFAGIYADFKGSPYSDATCKYKWDSSEDLLDKIKYLEDEKNRLELIETEQEKLKDDIFLEDNINKIVNKWKRILNVK